VRLPPPDSFVRFDPADVECSIPELFERHAHRRPDSVAVRTRGASLTYGEVNRAANRIARAILDRRGAGEEAIALIMEPELSIVPALLGVLKAGKIYVSLSPALPAPTSRALLDDADVHLVVTTRVQRAAADALVQPGRSVLDVDEVTDAMPASDLGRSIPPETLASIYYTSGSTGRSKGALQSHRNILHAMMNYTNDLHVRAGDRLALLHSYSFAASLTTVFGALLTGATLCPFDLPAEGVARLGPWMAAEGITIYYSGPSVFRHFVGTLTDRDRFPALRLVRLVGEPVTGRDVELFRAHFSADCLFVNALGSAETLMFRQYCVDAATPLPDDVVPVGYACDGLETLLLDPDGNEVGPDGVGEIVVRSRYLSPGYWRQLALTNAAFRPEPGDKDVRRYHTGDLGRMRADGCLFHLGRQDWQVKVRGHRVDLVQVERALLDHPEVEQAVVTAQADEADDTRLIAYVVARGEPRPSVSALREFLAERLPSHMMPAAFVTLDAFPLTANNKIDRQALPRPTRERPRLAGPFVAPRGPIEEDLARIWAGALALDAVGVHDNFLELGGDSLRATRIVTDVETAFRVELLSRSLLLDSPTVADMALVITAHLAAERGMSAEDVRPSPPPAL
jgi:amino acid adenylation domain-containing protein